jgi:hypothetical protein
MRSLKLWFVSFILFGTQLTAGDKAAPADGDAVVPLRYEEITLTDGKKLKKVVIKSYDAKAEKLLVVASGKAVILPIGQVPEPLASRLKADAPQAGSSTTSAPERKVVPSAAAPRPFYPQPAPVVRQEQPENLGAHKDAALARARNYYRYEFPVGSDAARVTALSFEMDEPTAIPGWNNRYRTQGRALLEWFDSKGWSYKRTTSTFEVTTEKGSGSPKVVDFAIKS